MSENHFLGITNFNYKEMTIEEKTIFHKKLYSYCYGKAARSLHNEDYAHNISQDVSFIVFKNIHKYNPKISKFITWLGIIIKREIIKVKKHRDAQKRQAPTTPILTETNDGDSIEDNRLVSDENIEEIIERKMLIESIRDVVSNFNERQRKIYYMYFVEEKTFSYIGKTVGLSHEGVRINVEKIKKQLESYFLEQNLLGA